MMTTKDFLAIVRFFFLLFRLCVCRSFEHLAVCVESPSLCSPLLADGVGVGGAVVAPSDYYCVDDDLLLSPYIRVALNVLCTQGCVPRTTTTTAIDDGDDDLAFQELFCYPSPICKQDLELIAPTPRGV